MKTWRLRLLVAAALMLLVLVAACSGGDAPDADPTATSRSGLRPTSTPRFVHNRSYLCPNLPREACLLPGDKVNVYDALSLDQPRTLRIFHDQQQDWVLGDNVQAILMKLNTEVVLEPWTLRQNSLFFIELRRKNDQTYSLIEGLLVDVDAQAMGFRAVEGQEVQWPVPEGLVETILNSLSDVTPTPTVANTRVPYTPPSPPPTETPLPRSETYFDHPERELTWDGPDDQVTSFPRGHCGPPREVQEIYGVPALLRFGENGHWYRDMIDPGPTWERTGYRHNGWEIWQGENPKTIYLLHDDLDDIAFEYENFGCI